MPAPGERPICTISMNAGPPAGGGLPVITMRAGGQTIESLARNLSSNLNRQVVDRTGLTGAMRTRAAALALAGDHERAKTARIELQHFQPGVTLIWIEQNSDMSDEPRRRVIEGLRLAGLPE